MDPLLLLLLEMGARAKTAETALVQRDARIAELEAQVEKLTPKPEPKEA